LIGKDCDGDGVVAGRAERIVEERCHFEREQEL
jgi:hypothetical protein